MLAPLDRVNLPVQHAFRNDHSPPTMASACDTPINDVTCGSVHEQEVALRTQQPLEHAAELARLFIADLREQDHRVVVQHNNVCKTNLLQRLLRQWSHRRRVLDEQQKRGGCPRKRHDKPPDN